MEKEKFVRMCVCVAWNVFRLNWRENSMWLVKIKFAFAVNINHKLLLYTMLCWCFRLMIDVLKTKKKQKRKALMQLSEREYFSFRERHAIPCQIMRQMKILTCFKWFIWANLDYAKQSAREKKITNKTIILAK